MRHYTNKPKKLERADYEALAARAASELIKIRGVMAVYLLGDAWAPGVSDMDLLVVCAAGQQPALPGPWSLGGEAPFIFTHRYLAMDERAVQGFLYLFPPETTHLRLIAGTGASVDDPHASLGPQEYKDMAASVFFDVLVSKLLPMAGDMDTRHVDVRARIGALYSLRYSEMMLRLLCGWEMPPALREKIIRLRSEWFAHSEEESLALLEQVSRECVLLIMEMTRAFTDYTGAAGGSRSQLRTERYTCIFGPWTPEDFLRTYSRKHLRLSLGGRTLRHDTLLLPGELAVYVAHYAAQEGVCGDRIRAAFSGVPAVSASAGVRAHAHALGEAFADYTKSAGVHKIPYTFGFSPAPASPLRRLIIAICTYIK